MSPTTHTAEELKNSELSTLIDMLVEETVAYTKLLAAEGFSDKSNACKEVIINLQAVIRAKHDLEKKAT